MTKKLVYGKMLLVLLLVIMSCAFIYAADFDVTYSPRTDSIYATETAYYDLNIFNHQTIPDRFQIYTISASWDISPTLVTVAQGTSDIVSMEITSLDSRVSGPNLVPVTIKSVNTGKTETQNIYVYIKSTNAAVPEYVPNVAMQINMNNEIDPRQRVPIEIYLRNKNPLDIKELKVVINSDLFSKEYTTTLGPLEEKTNQVLFELDPLYAPGKHTINVQLIRNNQTINQVTKEVEIVSYSTVDMEQTKSTGFMSSTQIITLINHGNYEAIKQVKIPMGFFARIFTTSSLNYHSLNENGISYIAWDVPLTPEKEQAIRVTTSYLIILVLIIIAAVITALYYIFRSPVLLYKQAKIVASTEEGTSEVKVKLHIRNRSGKIIKNIKIMDKYPKITEVEAESVLGTTTPTKLLSADKTTSVLMWTLESLEPYEERLFTYKLRSKLKIIGNINLPGAKVKFQTKTGERSYVSDGVHMFHKSEATPREFVPVDELIKK